MNLYKFDQFTLTKDKVLSFFNERRVVIEKVEEKEEEPKKKTEFIVPEYKDKLFWIYYYLINETYAMVTNSFTEEKKIKISLVGKIKENKKLLKQFKMRKTRVESNLLNDEKITIETFIFICLLAKKNIIIFDVMKYSQYSVNDKDVFYIYYSKNEPRLYKEPQNLQTLFNVDCFYKPLKTIIKYKLADLCEIGNKLGLEIIKNGKRCKKKEIYDMINIKLNKENI